MSTRRFNYGVFHSPITPIGTTVIELPVDESYECMYPYWRFFNDAAGTEQVIPETGTVTVRQSFDGFIWHTLRDGVAVDIAREDFAVPTGNGLSIKVKATIAGVTGCNYWQMVVAKYI